jgi:serine/threonine-protein kinase
MTPTSPAVGETIAGYRIERLLGRGGMGAVYLATHERLRRQSALKVLVPELAEDERFRERFIRESELAASLDHPNVIPIYHADEDGGVLFLAMRYVDGSDLKQVLRDSGTLPPDRVAEIVGHVAGALDAAHAAGLVHRDVKPANILIEEASGRVFLSDFGVAKRTSSAGMTKTGSFLGSVDYCSPEQIRGDQLDGRADVYALGAVAYQCLGGQPPYAKDNDIAVVQAHLSDPIPAVTRLRPDLPPEVDYVLATALAKQADHRYATAGAFAERLQEALEGKARSSYSVTQTATQDGTLPRPSPPPPRAPVDDAAAPTRPLPPRPHSSRRRWLIVGAVAAVAVAAVAVVAALLLGNSPAPPATHPPVSTPPSVTAQIAAQINRIAPAQRAVNAALAALTAKTGTLSPLQTAGEKLQQRVLFSQGFSQRLTAHDRVGRAELAAFRKALASQAAYAGLLSGAPTSAAGLTAGAANGVVDAAENSEIDYTRLAGMATAIPLMPVTRRQALRIRIVVHHKTPVAPHPTGTTQIAPPPPPSTPAALTPVNASRFTVDYPSGWYIDDLEQQHPGYVDTTVRDSAAPSTTYLRVDYTPNVTTSLEQAALQQEQAHSKLSGYREIGFTHTTFAGYPAIRWEFVEPQQGVEEHKVDTFLIDGSHTGFAVLVQAPAAGYASWAPTFQEMYDSFALTASAPPPPSAAADDWPGGSGYTAILASVGSESTAAAIKSQAIAAGLEAGVLYSSNYSSLRPGYWVVFSGTFGTQPEAAQQAAQARGLGFSTAYARYVSP